jgi:micrococcal nuclease
MFEYRADILKIVDGDTVDVDIDLGFGIWLRNERVRIMGIDTPESRTLDKTEKIFGLAAKDRLKHLLGKTAILKTEVINGEDAKGKFGRILGDFFVQGGRRCGDILIEEGHAVAYKGQNKADVQSAHLKNRERLITEGVVKLL